jgi:hypothetical protein
MLAPVALLALALLQPRADAPTADAGAAATPDDSGALVRSAIEAERRFLALWRREWMESNTHERLGSTRMGAVHCHHDGRPYAPNLIRSERSARSWCPTWGLTERRQPATAGADEWRDGTLDSTLDARRRPRVVAARGALLRLLDSTERRVPTSDFVVGQRVRFLLDAGDADGAASAARGCRATPAWCAALVGYVHAVRGRLPAADSAFTVARSRMPPVERCAWDDVGPLLPPADRRRYAAMPCAARDSVSARVWWVSDPLLVEPGNERRVEHDARRTLVRLRAALSEDERHYWQPLDGGDALIEMVVRYGWPSRSVWGGRYEDANHTGWLAGHGSAGSPPYVTAEYVGGRPHVVPPLRTALDPSSARGADWQLHPEDVTRPGRWWPAEHYARRAGPLVQLPEGQWALFRRREASLLAVATALDPGPLGVAAGDSVDAALVVSWRPDSVRQLARVRAAAGTPLVLQAPTPSGAALVGVELPGDSAHPTAARARFGIAAPPSLAAMRPGEVAVSDPLLFDPPAGTDPLPEGADAAIARMLTTTRLRDVRRLGLYWESYGLAAGDTVDVAVRLERRDRSGLLRRLAERLSMMTEQDGAVAVRWREPQPGRAAVSAIDGPVPVLSRSLVLDVSGLPAGSYWLDVSVARPGQAAVQGRRELVIE